MREEEDELILSADERNVLLAALKENTYDPGKGKLTKVRAAVLRQVLLGRKVKWNEYAKAEVIDIPPRGLRFRWLEITGDEGITDPYHESAILNLTGACTHKGDSLPAVEFRDCKFHQKINLTGARFRFLSFKDSQLTRLQATDLHVDDSLILTGICSSQKDDGESIPVGNNPEQYIRGASSFNDRPPLEKEDSLENWLPNDNMRCLKDSVKEKVVDTLKAARPEPLCWVQLRNAHIGFDLDLRHAQLVAPAEYYENLSLTNSPMSSYALDLRGATITGRLAFNPDPHQEHSKTFRALGGVSLVRATIGGSVCASGAKLIAVEGSAFAAERATIRGHLFLDYSWEGQNEWSNFRAYGFVDLTNAVIGSSLYMGGALLRPDRWRRAGLVATGVTVGNLCELCAVDNLNTLESERFCSDGGVRLDNAVIHGNLNMNGACLHPDSFGYAMYASGIAVHGTADLMYFRGKHEDSKGAPFTAKAPIVLVRGQFHMTLRLRGAQLDLSEVKPTKSRRSQAAEAPNPEVASRNRDDLASDAAHDCCILADLIHIQSSFYLSAARRSGKEAVRTTIQGSVSMRRAFVGMNLHAEGSYISTAVRGDTKSPKAITSVFNSGVALDLSGTRVQGSARLRSYVPDQQKHEPGEALLFELEGTLKLQEMHIGDQLHLVGADIQYVILEANDLKSKHAPGELGLAIEASGINVKSYVYLGEFESMPPEGAQRQDKKQFPAHKCFCARGSVNFSRSLLQAGLFITYSEISSVNSDIAKHIEDHNREPRPRELVSGSQSAPTQPPLNLKGGSMYSLNTSTANVNLLRILDSTFIGTVKSFDLTASHGVRTSHMTVWAGGIDLWKSSLGFLDLKHLTLGYPRQIDPSDDDHPDILHLGQTKVDGGLEISCTVIPKLFETPKKNFYANLRGFEVGSLDDGITAGGWGQDICLKLVGFVCHRVPKKRDREPDQTGSWFQRWKRALNPYSYPADTPDTHWLRRENPTPKPPDSNWFVRRWSSVHSFIRNDQKTSDIVFTPSAYDQLAKVLREDGYERDSRVVLIEKWKQKTRYSSRKHLKIMLAIFGRLFHFGFSTAPALATISLGLILGAAMFCYGAYHGAVLNKDATMAAMATAKTNARNAQSRAIRDLAVSAEKETLAANLQDVYTQSRGHVGSIKSQEVETLIDGLHVSSAEYKREGTLASKQAMDSPEDFYCLVRNTDDFEQPFLSNMLESYWNSFIYASGEFIPLFHFDDTKRCKIKDSALIWQTFHLLYAAAGWIVTSLTLLTVPGILRRRENG